jgi:hypothetical protein
MEPQRQQRQIKRGYPFLISLAIHTILLSIMGITIGSKQPKVKPIQIVCEINAKDNDIVDYETKIQPISLVPEYQDSVSSDIVAYSESPSEDIVISSLNIESSDSSSSSPELLSESLIKASVVVSPGVGNGNKNHNDKAGNGFSQGIKDGIKNRLGAYGAGTGDVQISIVWDDYNDIDVWVRLIDGKDTGTISWVNRFLAGGYLDIDKNISPETNKAVENIFWSTDAAPYCQYVVYIQNYRQWDKNQSSAVLVRILVDGQETYKKISIKPADGLKKIHTFTRKPTKKINKVAIARNPSSHGNIPPTPNNNINGLYDNLIQPAPTFR